MRNEAASGGFTTVELLGKVGYAPAGGVCLGGYLAMVRRVCSCLGGAHESSGGAVRP